MRKTETKLERPDNWPDTLLVLDDGGSWDGLAVDPDDSPDDYIDAYLKSVGEYGMDTDPDDPEDEGLTGAYMIEHNTWARVEWDPETGKYERERFERANGVPVQYDRSYSPDDLSYLPDQYSIDRDK